MPRMAPLLLILIVFSHGRCARADTPSSHESTTTLVAEPLPAAAGDDPVTIQSREDRPIRRMGTSRTSSTVAPATTSSSAGWRSLLALAAVVGLILLLAWGYRTALGTTSLSLSRNPAGGGVMQVLARLSIAPRQGVVLLRVGPRLIVLGTGAERLTTLDVISDTETVAAISGQAAAVRPDSRSVEFRSMLQSQSDLRPDASEMDSEAPEDRTVLRLRDQLADTLQRLRKTSEGR